MKVINAKGVLALCLFVMLSACSSTSKLKNATIEDATASESVNLTADFSRSKLIAADFVATIRQIPETNPKNTVFHTEIPSTRFGELLLGALQKAGFDLRIGSESSAFWLGYSAVLDEQPSQTGNQIFTFIIAAGDVKLKRSYEVDDYGVKPAGSMFVRGANTENLVMDDSIFSIRKPSAISEPVTLPDPTLAEVGANDLQADAVPVLKPFVKTGSAAPNNVDANEGWKTEIQKGLEASVAALGPGTQVIKKTESPGDYSEFTNMYDTRQSRYQELFRDYEVVDSNILIFPNDSLILGKTNKAAVWQYANLFNPETDVMSVIGCSHGSSKVENGNAYLANGRAFRVKEEFVAAGFDTQKVLEEGCWANVDFPDMPARGVLVQHRRALN